MLTVTKSQVSQYAILDTLARADSADHILKKEVASNFGCGEQLQTFLLRGLESKSL